MQAVYRFNSFIDGLSEDKTQARAMKLAIAGTGIVWLLIMAFLAVSPFFHNPERFETVKIMLEPLPNQVVDKAEKTTQTTQKVPDTKAKEAAAPKQAEKKSVEKVAEPPAKKSEAPKTQPQKTEAQKAPAQTQSKQAPAPKAAEQPKPAPKPAPTQSAAPAKPAEVAKLAPAQPTYKKANIKYGKTAEQLMEEQLNSSSSAKEFDWDSMDAAQANTSVAQSSQQTAKAIDSSAALGGSAAAAATGTSGPVSAQSNKPQSSGASASGETTSRLSNVANVTPYSTSIGNGLSSQSRVTVATGSDGRLSLELSDGSARVLLEPKKPVITISPENARLIDNSRQVVITFRILAAGNVPLNGISFSPSSVLPVEIQSEIKEQISTWRFAPASADGQAKFEYSIIKR